LRDRLAADLGADQVFFDVDSIDLGADFRDVIASTLAACDVVIVLIGPTWLSSGADGARRIDDEHDVHRIEVAIRPENAASLSVARKLDLREEGLRQSYLYIDGAWRDHRIFAVTARERRSGEWWTGVSSTGSG
jgi:hypothetical protein